MYGHRDIHSPILALDDQRAHQARILIVDDEPANVALLTQVLAQAGYACLQSTTEPRQFLPLYQEFAPDLILMDLHMPHLDGFALLAQLGATVPADDYLPILMLTADSTSDAKRRALALGTADFLTKPIDTFEVLLRIRNLLGARLLHLELRQQNQYLDAQVRARTRDLEAAHTELLGRNQELELAQRELLERNRELEAAQHEILERLCYAGEYRDDSTGQHVQRVQSVATDLARALDLPETQVALIHQAAALHDVGKIGIPDAILLKPSTLMPEERQQMQMHTTIGGKILGGSQQCLLQAAEEIALTHHERWDGSGYPRGLAGEAIPLAGRIVAVADVFDALTSERPYKAAWPAEAALAEIARQSGRQFDPRVVAAFLRIQHKAVLDLPKRRRQPSVEAATQERARA